MPKDSDNDSGYTFCQRTVTTTLDPMTIGTLCAKGQQQWQWVHFMPQDSDNDGRYTLYQRTSMDPAMSGWNPSAALAGSRGRRQWAAALKFEKYYQIDVTYHEKEIKPNH